MSQPFSLPALEKIARDAEQVCKHCKHFREEWSACTSKRVGKLVNVYVLPVGPEFGCRIWEAR